MTIEEAKQKYPETQLLSDEQIQKYCELTDILANIFMESVEASLTKSIDNETKTRQ